VDRPLLDRRILETMIAAIDSRLDRQPDRPVVFGLCGAQGSGKSTIAAALARQFVTAGVGTVVISLDDLYLTRREREMLAGEVHPLLRTRGVPGTHDVALGLSLLADIDAAVAAPLPRFDKADDDRVRTADWDIAPSGTRLVLFEGWCIGARPQSSSALETPVNDLERIEDADGRWRRYVNDALAADYQRLFDRIDLLALLAAPSFETVFGWRAQQERALRSRTGAGMSGDEVVRFVQHYERLTRHMLAEMPDRADLLVRLDERRKPISVSF